MLLLFLVATFVIYAQEVDTAALYEEEYEQPPPEEEFSDDFIQKNGQGWYMDSIQWRNIPDSVRNRWKKDPDFWYGGLTFGSDEKKPKSNNSSESSSGNASKSKSESSGSGLPWFNAMLWFIIVAGFLCFILLMLSNSNAGLFRKSNKAIADQDMEVETDDIFAINYQREIDKAAEAGNYRFAIRLMFLRLLKNLSERNIIQYKHDRTNFDYLLQLNSTRYYNDFFRLTRNYEYSWYGQFEINPDTYKKIKADFEQFTPATK